MSVPKDSMISLLTMRKPFWFRRIFGDLYTLFLFTQSDIRTALLPITFFSIAAAPLASPVRLLETTFWIWLHQLQCTVANQIKAPDEDKINKPSRPIPAGRITVEGATILRWALVPICLAYSARYSTELMQTSLSLMLLTVWYNERDGDKGPLSKNFLTALIYGVGEFGGTLVAGHDRTQVSPTGQIAVEVMIVVFMSTIHAQDFKDADGDHLTGRRTFPIAYPAASRFAIGLAIPLWSILLTVMWQLDLLCGIAFVGFGYYVGARFMLYRTVEDDKLSCKYYSAWFSIHHLFPAYWYYHHGANQYPNILSHDLFRIW
ncbi:UbiA prenyltransferase family-domain-containing protein [Pisolithus marmoratus]|nr:UbiA prenyltransferase family-domain-containing protein [Pisolithus marmoratus]